jgi:hypothetical protein
MTSGLARSQIHGLGPLGEMGAKPPIAGPRVASSIGASGPDSSNVFATQGSPPAVNFTESGLPTGTTWYVNCSGPVGLNLFSASRTIVQDVPDGNYFCTIQSANPSWAAAAVSFTVNGTTVSEPVLFSLAYTVTFTETGLPNGMNWDVFLEGITGSSTTSKISFPEANATDWYDIGPVPGYSSVPDTDKSPGYLTVNGSNLTVSVVFTLITFSLTFTETGLPSGTNWSVTVELLGTANGTTVRASTEAISFTEAELNIVSYSVVPVSGYTSSPSSGLVSFGSNGGEHNQTVNITFTPNASTSGFLGLPGDTGYYVLGGIGVVVSVGVAVALALRSRHH